MVITWMDGKEIKEIKVKVKEKSKGWGRDLQEMFLKFKVS